MFRVNFFQKKIDQGIAGIKKGCIFAAALRAKRVTPGVYRRRSEGVLELERDAERSLKKHLEVSRITLYFAAALRARVQRHFEGARTKPFWFCFRKKKSWFSR